MKDAKYLRLSEDPWGVHQRIIGSVNAGESVLEVGCASGYMSKELIKKGCKVYGIEIDQDLAKKAVKYLSGLIIGDIENEDTLKKIGKLRFDSIILADVLEHLRNPAVVARNLTRFLKTSGRVYISVPNIAFLTNRIHHLIGNFDYTTWGIMDENHLRFFTKRSILGLVKKTGLKIVKFDFIGNFTQLPLYMQTLYPFLKTKDVWRKMEYKITGLWPEGLAVQFFLVCRKK